MRFQPDSLYYGDCLDVLREWPAGCVDLCYLDPPFNSKSNYNILFGRGQDSGGGNFAQAVAFEDTWTWDDAAQDRVDALELAVAHPAHDVIRGLRIILGECGMLAYLSYMAERLAGVRRVLKPTGSVYLHCDPTASHYLKAVMDAVFGAENFRNEIVWRRTGSHNSAHRFGPIHDVILFYAASPRYTHRPVYTDYLTGHVESYFRKRDERGRYWTNAIHGAGKRGGASGQPWRGYDPTAAGRHWAVPGEMVLAFGIDPKLPQHEKLDALADLGLIDFPSSGLPTYRQYLDASPGQLLQDVWAYQPHTKGALHGTDAGIDEDTRWIPPRDRRERLGYPTQKPLGLMERILRSSSGEGDIVLDPFCGCGTTIAAAHKLKRQFVGIDISHFAIDLVRERRLKDKRVPIYGVPVDLHTASKLAHDSPFEFEKWAVTRVPGMVPNQRQVGDGGIDGRGTLLGGGIVLAQVKGGKAPALGHVRDFRHVLSREDAACGVFATLGPMSAKAKQEAHGAGYLHVGANRYPKAQLWSIADYFQDRLPMLPPLADPYTGKPMQHDILAG